MVEFMEGSNIEPKTVDHAKAGYFKRYRRNME